LAWGVVLGAFLHLVVQLPVIFKLGFHYRPLFSLRDSNLRKIFKLMIPRLFGLAINQVNLVVVTIFGSMLAVGSLAVYNFANNLQSLPLGLIGVAFAMAAFPTLSAAAARHDQKEFNSRFASTVRLIVFTIIPVMVLFIILRLEITELILGSGKFTWSAMVATANTLGIFSISLAAQCLVQLFARAFFARQNTVVPFVASLITALLNILLCWILIDQFAVLGLALAFTISSIVNFLILAIVLRWQIGRINENRILSTFNKVTFSSLIMTVIILLIKYFSFSFIIIEGFWRILLFCASATLIGLVMFCVVCKIIKCQEFEIIIDAFRKKVLRKVKIENESIRKVE
jgi:putative peptidoglycan lipid II flippase